MTELALLLRGLRERRRLILGLSAAAAAMAVMVVSLYSSVGAQFDEVFETMPAALESMFDGANLSTPEGFIQVELFTFVGPGLAIAAGIAAGANAIAGAEQGGRLTLVLSGPVHRHSVVTSAIATTLCAVIVVSGALFVGIAAGAALGDVAVSTNRVIAACFSLGLLGASIGLIALATGAWSGSKGLAVAVATTIALASYAIYTFFPLSDRLEPGHRLSLWYPFANGQPLMHGLRWDHAGILALVGATAATSAYWGFQRRDLRT